MHKPTKAATNGMAGAPFLLSATLITPSSAALIRPLAMPAMTHVHAIAQVPHPIGSAADTAARDYLVAQLSAFGMGPQVVTAIGSYKGSGAPGALIAGRANDIVARLPGTANSRAILLMAH